MRFFTGLGIKDVPVGEKTYLFRAHDYDFYIQLLRKVGLFGYSIGLQGLWVLGVDGSRGLAERVWA